MRTHPEHNPLLAGWLLLCAAAIFAMIVLGGVTRLTGSGLSIVEWQPLIGAIPPLNDADWIETFEKYKAFPEYQQVNQRMSLHEFKTIFYFEYSHRLLGRLIGLLFFIPFIVFYFRRLIPTSLTPRLLGIFILGGLQGVLGWYMVKSGLVDNPRVSQYRLTAHLGLAVAIYGYILWVALSLLQKAGASRPVQPLYKWAIALCALIYLMILSGGLVAGTHAGLIYNTFPLMGDRLIPSGLLAMEPFWINVFENTVAIQFNHRLLALIIFLSAGYLCIQIFRQHPAKSLQQAAIILLATLALQLTLGIATLLHQVPVILAAAHQSGAIVLFSAALFLLHKLR